MKRLVVLIAFALIATIALSQQQRTPLNNIKCTLGEYENLEGTQPYLFHFNGWGGLHIISYETILYKPDSPEYKNAIAKREVHIFRENPENLPNHRWVKVSEKPLQTDYYKWDSVGYYTYSNGVNRTEWRESYKFYYTAVYDREAGEKNGCRIIQLNDTCVAIFLTNIQNINKVSQNGERFTMSWDVFETYKIIVIDKKYNSITYNLVFSTDTPYSYKTFPMSYHAQLLSQLNIKDIKKDTFTLKVDDESFKFIKEQ